MVTTIIFDILSFPTLLQGQYDLHKNIRFSSPNEVSCIVIEVRGNQVLQLFQRLPANLQWIMVFFIPTFKLFHNRILSKIVFRMAEDNLDAEQEVLSTAVSMKFGILVAIILASANEFTVWCYLVVDLIIHLISSYDVMQ